MTKNEFILKHILKDILIFGSFRTKRFKTLGELARHVGNDS